MADLPTDLCWLTPHEAERAAGMSYPWRRNGYLLRRLVAKHAIAATLGWPRDWPGLARIAVGNAPTGAPYVLLDGRPAGLEVSLSDRAGVAVCVVAGDAVGCDLEIVEWRSPGFVRDFLTEAEQAYVAGQPGPDARAAAANLVWSAKESALKLLRTGLRRDTRSVEVRLTASAPASWARLLVRTTEGLTVPGWWRRDGRFLFTVANHRRQPPPVALEESDLAGAAGLD